MPFKQINQEEKIAELNDFLGLVVRPAYKRKKKQYSQRNGSCGMNSDNIKFCYPVILKVCQQNDSMAKEYCGLAEKHVNGRSQQLNFVEC